MPTIKDSTWAVKPPAGALKAGALSPDGLGLLTVVVEEGDERGRPTMLKGATCVPGSDDGAVLGSQGPELDVIVAPILPCLGPVGGLGVYVCMYVRHAQKIAKLFFSVRSTQFSLKLNILFKKKLATSWAPKY